MWLKRWLALSVATRSIYWSSLMGGYLAPSRWRWWSPCCRCGFARRTRTQRAAPGAVWGSGALSAVAPSCLKPSCPALPASVKKRDDHVSRTKTPPTTVNTIALPHKGLLFLVSWGYHRTSFTTKTTVGRHRNPSPPLYGYHDTKWAYKICKTTRGWNIVKNT